MSWEEALELMRSGKRVTHKYFTSDEYFEMQFGTVICEQGYNMTDWFKNEEWQLSGWSIKKPL